MNLCLGVFTLEAALKIVAHGMQPRRYFDDSWNRFDFAVVLVSYVEFAYPLGGLAMLRLLRLLRMLKVCVLSKDAFHTRSGSQVTSTGVVGSRCCGCRASSG